MYADVRSREKKNIYVKGKNTCGENIGLQNNPFKYVFFMRQKSWHGKREICGMCRHKRGAAVPFVSLMPPTSCKTSPLNS